MGKMNGPHFFNDQLRLAREHVDFALRRCDCEDLIGKVQIEFNRRFTRRMGDACYPDMRVRLSAPLWPKADEKERRETAIHEACHLTAYHRFGLRIKAHGAEWREMMERCGVEPTVCHQVDVSTTTRRYRAACGCDEGCLVGPTVARRILRAVRYRCRKCGDMLRPWSEQEVSSAGAKL